MSYYTRNLPHWHPANATYFITFRLAGSLPLESIRNLKHKRQELIAQLSHNQDNQQSLLRSHIEMKIFKRYEDLLDGHRHGPQWLSVPNIAKLVAESIEYRNGSEYFLYAYCIMPNHVHMVVKPINFESNKRSYSKSHLTKILQKLKSYTARVANKELDKKGPFWQSESYDHVIQDMDEFERTIAYTLNNPVKAGLAEQWRDWPYTYCNAEFAPDF